MAKKITQEQMLEAIKDSQGLVSKIQRRIAAIIGESIAWETVERYIQKWDATQEAVKAEKELMLDIAENNIFKELVNGDTSVSKWYLRMKGKERGYEDTPIIKLDNTDPLNINLQGELFSDEELKQSSAVEVPEYEEESKND